MYQRDVREIMNICHAKQSVLPVVTFTLTTIQAGLSTCLGQIVDVNDMGSSSRFMWGKKGDGYDYTKRNDAFLWGKVNHIKDTLGTQSVEACVEAIMLFITVPNLGMVKASFVMQMLGFDVACIDSHNLTRLGMSPNAVKVGAKLKTETKYKKVCEYIVMTQTKGTEYWWNTWCDYVAGNRANRLLDTGDVVSKFHVDCVIR